MIDISDYREKAKFYPAHEKIALARRLENACDEIERLRAALEKYGRHTGVCHFLGGKDCNCGWENIQRTHTAAQRQTLGNG
jgi:hypothetical protein